MQTHPEAPMLSGDVPGNPGSPAITASPPISSRRRALWRDSRELGLALGIFCGKHLLKTRHLHYGYWPQDLPVKLPNLAKAQQCLSDFILGHIPPGVRTILDVGC